MKQFTINIGLHNNPLAIKRADGNYSLVQERIQALLELSFSYSSPFYRIETGNWDGEKEPTFVAYVEADDSTIDKKVELLCEVMTQVCIPYHSEDKSKLVYQAGWEGETFTFSPDYFIK